MDWNKIGSDYFSGDRVYKISCLEARKWELSCTDGYLSTYKSLKEAKAAAEQLDAEMREEMKQKAVVKAFNGAIIGEFDIVYQTAKIIVLHTSKGNWAFDKATGVQANTKANKFSNKVEILQNF